jgi:TetR/AcrR family transcriptional regulator
MKRGRKKTENPATARRILTAAEQHFAAQGLAGARTEQIAADAHANKAMLYYYFGNKRRLHRAVLENLLRQLRNNVYEAPVKNKAPGKRLREFILRYFDFLTTHPNYPRLVQRESMEATKNFDWIVREYLRPFHGRLVSTIREGIADNSFRRVDATHMAFSILGMTTSYFAATGILSAIAGRQLLAEPALLERKAALLDFIDHGLFRHEKPRTELEKRPK